MNDVTVFHCGLPRDHQCDSTGQFIYGGDDVPTVTDPKLAGKGYSWGSATCSVCGMTAMDQALWRDE